MTRKLNHEEIKELRHMWEHRNMAGINASNIAQSFGVSKYTVYYWTNPNTRKYLQSASLNRYHKPTKQTKKSVKK